MREIKFRAWIESEKEMMYQDENTASAVNGLNAFSWNVGQVKGETPVIMQYTGLKDKNGKEIYEGDIVETESVSIRDVSDPYPHRRIISWNEDEARLDFYWIDGRKQTSGQTFCKNNLEKYWTIIGNIYENPDLAKAEMRAKIPQIVEELRHWHLQREYGCCAHSEGQDCCVDELIKSLTVEKK